MKLCQTSQVVCNALPRIGGRPRFCQLSNPHPHRLYLPPIIFLSLTSLEVLGRLFQTTPVIITKVPGQCFTECIISRVNSGLQSPVPVNLLPRRPRAAVKFPPDRLSFILYMGLSRFTLHCLYEMSLIKIVHVSVI